MNAPSAPTAETSLVVPPARRRRPYLLGTLALGVAGWAALALGAATPLKGLAERRASAALGRTMTIGGPLRIIVTPFSLRFRADKVRVANPDWARGAALLDAGQVEARIATFDLLLGKPAFRAIAVRDGLLDLERSADGKQVSWSGGKSGGLFDLAAIRQIDADRLTLRYRDPATHSDVRVALTQGGWGIVDLAGGGLIQGRETALNGSLRSAEDRGADMELRARAPDFALVLQGNAQTPLQLGTAQLTAKAQGDDFAQLAALGGVTLPAMPHYDLAARIDRARTGWRFSHIAGRIGETDLAGSLALTRRKARPLIVASLSSHRLDRADAMALLGMRNADEASVEELAGATADDGGLLPDAPLSAPALQRFDALVDYRAERLSGIDAGPAHLSLKLALLGGRMQLTPAGVDLAGGFVSSDIFIDARRSPALVRADIRLSPTPMGRLLADWGIAPAGTTAMVRGRIQLAGRGTTLREAIGSADGRIALVLPAGDVRTERASGSALDMAVLREAIFAGHADGPAPAAVNCGLIAFTVRGGVAKADPILIDTQGSVLSGSGTIDLSDETIDLKLTPSAKTIGWFDRPAPVTISGTLGDAFVAREPVNWFRPASFLGITMLLPDLKRILGFVDPDETQAPACGPILQGATASAQRGRAPELASLR